MQFFTAGHPEKSYLNFYQTTTQSGRCNVDTVIYAFHLFCFGRFSGFAYNLNAKGLNKGNSIWEPTGFDSEGTVVPHLQ